MSVLTVSQVFTLPLASPLHKLVLLRLADIADTRGESARALSLQALAAECSVERREVSTVLIELQGDGWLALGASIRNGVDPPGYRLNLGKIRSVSLAHWQAEWEAEIARETRETNIAAALDAKARAKRTQPVEPEPSLLDAEPEPSTALAVVPSIELEKPDPRADELLFGAHTSSPQALRFKQFWAAYPRKTGKGGAWKAWDKIRPTSYVLDAMLAALAWQKTSEHWTKDGGDYIPHPATWLNQRRWMDEPQEVTHRFTPRNQRNLDLIKKYSVTGQQRREEI